MPSAEAALFGFGQINPAYKKNWKIRDFRTGGQTAQNPSTSGIGQESTTPDAPACWPAIQPTYWFANLLPSGALRPPPAA
jgi:hypothetical protein